MFKNTTGFACPSCGSTRSLMSIISGDFGAAMLLNPLGYLAAFGLLWVPVAGIVGKVNGRNYLVETLTYLEAKIKQPKFALPLVALVISNWVWNIFKGL
ncbi:DUF2752 domain-containing protein [Flavobacteriales bacterium]|nr:DUF2752 domain-containing protein [Flavobacteriales bacterium]